MKLNIKNLLFQPLALHLATDGEGLHLSAREVREILTEHVSQEIQLAAARGLVSLIGKINEAVDPVPASAAAVDEPGIKQKKGRAR
jgi:hypothetical protein